MIKQERNSFFSKKDILVRVSFLFTIILFFELPAYSFPTNLSKEHIPEVKQYRYNKFYIEAICQKALGNKSAEYELLQHALTLNPQSPECLFELAKLQAQNPLVSAEKTDSLYREVLLYDSCNNQYKWEIAKYEIHIGKFDHASILLKELTKDPLFRQDAFMFLSNIYEHDGKDSLFLHTLNQWEQEEGATENIKLAKYRAYSHMKCYDQALNVVKELCRKYPQNEYYPILEAEIYLDNNNPDEAFRTYQKVIKDVPDNCYAQLFLLQYYTSTGKNTQATRQIEEIILNPKQETSTRASYIQAYINMFKQENAKGHIDSLFQLLLKQPMSNTDLIKPYITYLVQKNTPDSEYIPVLKKMLEIDPADKQSRLRLAWSLLQRKNYQDVINTCKEGIDYDKTQILFYIMGGNAATILKDRNKALEFFKNGLPYASTYSEKETISDYFSAYGDLLNQMGEDKKSYALYDSSLVYNPSNVSTLNNYAYYLSLKNEQLPKAKRMAELAVKYSPEEPTFLDTYAWVFFMEGDYQSARTYIEKAMKYLKGDPSDGNIYEHAGDIYMQLGLEKEALESWGKALEKGIHSDLLNKKIKTRKVIQ